MGQHTILLAEDDPDHQALILRAIEETGIPCRIDVVENGSELIDYLFAPPQSDDREGGGTPELILLDLGMPEMDGFQVLQVLRRVRDDGRSVLAPVVILTASDNADHAREAYRLGANSYVPKPTGFAELTEAVARIVKYWLVTNHGPPADRSDPQYPGVQSI
ncbi:MAG: response regulator [Planctomycetes bacterium]|nr:response regulator [Planctomycetota bacterium]